MAADLAHATLPELLGEVGRRLLALSVTAPAAPAAQPQLVDRNGLLAALAIGGEALHALERRGRVPHVMVGARRRYDVAIVVAALAAPQSTAEPRRTQPAPLNVVALSRPRRAGGAR
jgi:hypothetical protein